VPAAPTSPASSSAARPTPGSSTADRVLDAALRAFAAHGYEATSLDALASELGIRKQTILYHFTSKEQLLDAVITAAGAELIGTVEDALAPLDGAHLGAPGWPRVEAAVRSVFRLAGRRPELLGLLREVSRLGPPAATRLREQLDPFVARATTFLDEEMASGGMRRQDSLLLLLNAYSTVIGAATEVEVLRTFGVEPTARALVRRRAELIEFLRSALVAPAGS
jgi:TetR/AcrR family transcriptional regulator